MFAAPDYPLAASLMEQATEQCWERGEVATMARWVLVLPEQQVREHARLLLTTALYLLCPVTTLIWLHFLAILFLVSWLRLYCL